MAKTTQGKKGNKNSNQGKNQNQVKPDKQKPVLPEEKIVNTPPPVSPDTKPIKNGEEIAFPAEESNGEKNQTFAMDETAGPAINYITPDTDKHEENAGDDVNDTTTSTDSQEQMEHESVINDTITAADESQETPGILMEETPVPAQIPREQRKPSPAENETRPGPMDHVPVELHGVTPTSAHSDEMKLEKFLLMRKNPKTVGAHELGGSGIKMNKLGMLDGRVGKFRLKRNFMSEAWTITVEN